MVIKKKRKRGGHNSACWVCQRDHRACDVSRPCKRCVSIGAADDCTRPPSDRTERPKRRKFVVVTTESFANHSNGDNHPIKVSSTSTYQLTNHQHHQHHYPSTATTMSTLNASSMPIESQTTTLTTTETVSEITTTTKLSNSFSGWQWQQQQCPNHSIAQHQDVDDYNECDDASSSSPSSSPSPSIDDDVELSSTDKNPSVNSNNSAQQSSKSTEAALPDKDDKEQLLLALLKEVQQLNQTTGRLKDEQSMLGHQLSVLQQKSSAKDTHINHHRPHHNNTHHHHRPPPSPPSLTTIDPSLLDSVTCPSYLSQSSPPSPPSSSSPSSTSSSSSAWRSRGSSSSSSPPSSSDAFPRIHARSASFSEDVIATQSTSFDRFNPMQSDRPQNPRDYLRYAHSFLMPFGMEDVDRLRN